MSFVEILGVKINKSSYDEVLGWIEKRIKNQNQGWIATPNPEIILKAQGSGKFKQIINSADLRISDGIGISIAARYLNEIDDKKTKIGLWMRIWIWKMIILAMIWDKNSVEKILPQISGDELVFKLIPMAKEKKWKIFLLGGKRQNAKLAKEKIEKNYGIKVKSNSGATRIEKESEVENKEIINEINEFQPDILLVAYGAPYQEIWISENLKKLKTYVAIGIGGTIDDIASNNQTPQWLRKRGLRWLWRVIKEPKRIGRIWKAVVVFGWRMVRN